MVLLMKLAGIWPFSRILSCMFLVMFVSHSWYYITWTACTVNYKVFHQWLWKHQLTCQIFQAALSMISPGWAAAFASPPAAMALAMIAAGTSGGEIVPPPRTTQLRRDTSLLERRTTRLHTFSSFQNPLETPNRTPPMPKDKAAAKAAALAAARDLERNAKIGSGRGLSAVAMATSAQRRSITDSERAKRWSTSEAMGSAWTECLQPFDSKSVSGRDFAALSYKYVAVLVASFALARNMQRMEVLAVVNLSFFTYYVSICFHTENVNGCRWIGVCKLKL